jgi:FkbM family methyltransferase
MNLKHFGRRIERRVERWWLGHTPRSNAVAEPHGTIDPWLVDPQGLDADSLVYSFGVGTEISFDLSLIARYGLTVHAFDPTPICLEWVQRQSLPRQFCFHDFGIADYDGTAQFTLNEGTNTASYSLLDRPQARSQAVEGRVYRFDTIRERLGHTGIDILKMDIEGAEYGVIPDVLRSEVRVRQLLVEFHHRFPGIGRHRTREIVALLERHGYQIFYISQNNREYSFLRP